MIFTDLRRHLRQQPFQAFRLRTASGSTFRVLEPEFCGTNGTEVYLGLEPDGNGVPTRTVYLDLSLITEIEPIREKLTTPEEPGSNGSADGEPPA